MSIWQLSRVYQLSITVIIKINLHIFQTSIVHLHEHSYALCCNLVYLDTSCCYEGEEEHVKLLNVINKINHQILCILLDYIYITHKHICTLITV